MLNRHVVAGCGLLGLAVIVAYHGSLGVPFHFDDIPGIVDNPSIRHLSSLGRVLSPPSDFGTTVNGRPLLNLTLAANYAVGGVAPRGYHVVNVAIHLLAALTLFGIVRRTLMLRRAPHALAAALACALVWAVHPLQTESVTYVIQRAEALAALFTLLTLYCFIRSAEAVTGSAAAATCLPKAGRRRTVSEYGPSAASARGLGVATSVSEWGASRVWLSASVAACLLGTLTKETVVVAPVLVLLYDATFIAGGFRPALRARWRTYAALACTWVVVAALVAASANRGGTAGFGAGVSAYAYALTQSRAIVHYLVLAFWPASQVFDYGMGVTHSIAAVMPDLLGIGALLAGVVVAARRRPAAAFLAAAFFLTLAPSSSVVPIATQTMAEHRMYLPLATVVVLVMVPLVTGWGRRSWLLVAPIVVGLAVLTIERNQVYGSALSLWRDTVAKTPDNARAQNNLGKALIEAGDTPAAMRAFDIALRVMPEYPETHNNVGYALAQSGKWSEAVAQYQESLRLRPANPRAHDNLGNALVQLNRLPDAVAEFQTALRLRPEFPDAEWGLGNALAQSGRTADAIAHYERALQEDPHFADAHYSLGAALADTGAAEAALAQYQEALRLKPAFPEAHNNLGNLLLKRGDPDGALAEYRAALAQKPDYADARVNLANVLADRGEFAAAVTEYTGALKQNPANADARLGLGMALAQSGRLPEAITAFAEVVRLRPNDVAARANLGNALLVSGHVAEAVASYEAALRLDPTNANLRANLRQAQAMEGGSR